VPLHDLITTVNPRSRRQSRLFSIWQRIVSKT
jgi:hypothetical protein